MKIAILTVVCLAVLTVATEYTDKYDYIDFEEIMTNCRLLAPYIKCCLGEKKKCTKDGLELKSHITEVLDNNCADCNEHQKELSQHLVSVIYNTQKTAWKKLLDLYDPKGEYIKKYQSELDNNKAAGGNEKYKECDLETERAVEE